MLYRIYTKRLYYEIELNGKYTVLRGDSGSDKSLLHSLIYDYNNGDRSVHIEYYKDGIWKSSNVKFFAVVPNDGGLFLNSDTDESVFVIDENASVFRQKNVATILKESRHQFC